MSAALAVVAAAERAEMPPEVRRKIALFLAAGMTGKIVLNVKDGRVLAWELTECGRLERARLDAPRQTGQDSID